jgi:hypothetical protein
MRIRAFLSRAASILVVVAGTFALVIIVDTSLVPEAYFYYTFQDRSTWEWPMLGVLIFSMITLLETLAAYLVFRLARPWGVWQRALLVSAVLFPWAACQTVLVVHSPGYFMLHIVWVWFLLAFLVLTGVVAGAAQAYEKFIPARRQPKEGSV